ncbi:hypothetical protein N7462_000529 [Penicillium macrosclerotiorum]|uniref:uncharacterized protein n=1 Tax=Penicillium macrosclerotiorum TaxID=303699 RepID=UPI002546F6F0|nr:uncharacterized protein N7462_000529 [Penicillium macrosclerotiorum]KAJ5698524.1 hypothetical protein N7462_000529 [Penicillium macrosclerotiorum]
MTVPEPPFKLEGHCSAIHSNTLYVFSANGFAYIPLEVNGTWHSLKSGVAVSNATCVIGGMEGNNDDEALYVVGGTATDSDSNYPGLQRYSFSGQTWATLGSAATSMTSRVGHGAGYLETNSSIIVYAGHQDGSTGASSESFLISTVSPYGMESQLDQGAPALSSPVLLTWNTSTVAMIGGSDTNYGVYFFRDGPGWTTSAATLPTAVSSSSHGALLSNSDGSNKIFELFDMDVSPNTVTSYELVDSDGNEESPASTVGASSSKKRSSSSYPTYNSTFASSNKWSNYALAQGGNGLVVLSSGKSNDSLAIFNQTSNSWVNSTLLFQGKSQQAILKPTTTSSTTTTPTSAATTSASTSASSTPTSTGAAAASGSHTDTNVIIGATLGSVCGVALILLLILWLLKRGRQHREQNGKSRGIDKDRLSFQDQGIESLADGAYPMAKSPVPVATMSADSLAIISGKYAGEKSLKPPPAKYGYGLSATPGKSSPLSTIPSSGLAPSSMYSEDAYRDSIAPSEPGNKPGDRTTDEGWGKYFEDNNATNLAGMQSDRSTVSSVYTKSDYRGSAWPMTNLTPLNFGFLDQPKPLGRVHSGSPTTENASTGRNLFIPESQSARISSADSISVASDDDPHDTNWARAHQSSWLGRPTSSNYTTSFYNTSTNDLPGVNAQAAAARQSNGRRSSVVIPDDIDEIPIQHRGNVNSDMSWLNLHADR